MGVIVEPRLFLYAIGRPVQVNIDSFGHADGGPSAVLEGARMQGPFRARDIEHEPLVPVVQHGRVLAHELLRIEPLTVDEVRLG